MISVLNPNPQTLNPKKHPKPYTLARHPGQVRILPLGYTRFQEGLGEFSPGRSRTGPEV